MIDSSGGKRKQLVSFSPFLISLNPKHHQNEQSTTQRSTEHCNTVASKMAVLDIERENRLSKVI